MWLMLLALAQDFQKLYMTMFKTGEENTNLDRNSFNSFYHPMGKGSGGTDGTFDNAKELQFQAQIGAESIPERPIEFISQAYYNLKKGTW